jgi:O-antigen ligase
MWTLAFKSPVDPSMGTIGRAAADVAIAAVPIVGVFAPLGLAPLMAIAAVLGVVYYRCRERIWPLPPRFLIALFAGLVIWSAASVAWSIEPHLTMAKIWRHAGNLIAGAALLGVAAHIRDDAAGRICRLFVCGLVAAALALVFVRAALVPVGALFPYDGGMQSPLNPYNRGATVLAVLMWPAALYARRFGNWLAVALVAAGTVLIATYASQAAQLAAAAGIVAAALIALHRAFAIALAAVLMIVFLAMPRVPLALPPPSELQSAYHFPNSHYHRLMIWKFTAERIAERPFLGWGLEASKAIPGGKAEPGIDELMPLHPHNAALQVWLELGAIGALMASALSLFIGDAIRRLPRASAVAAGACFASGSAVSLVSYGIWQSWWIAALFMAASLCMLAFRSDAARAR